MHIDVKESNFFFSNHNKRELDMFPEGLNDIVIEWCENVTDGKLNPMTRKDSRKYEYRVRGVRNSTRSILMDTGKFKPKHLIEKDINKFVEAQKELESLRG